MKIFLNKDQCAQWARNEREYYKPHIQACIKRAELIKMHGMIDVFKNMLNQTELPPRDVYLVTSFLRLYKIKV